MAGKTDPFAETLAELRSHNEFLAEDLELARERGEQAHLRLCRLEAYTKIHPGGPDRRALHTALSAAEKAVSSANKLARTAEGVKFLLQRAIQIKEPIHD